MQNLGTHNDQIECIYILSDQFNPFGPLPSDERQSVQQYGLSKGTIIWFVIITLNDLCWRLRHLALGYHGVQLLAAPEPWTQSTQAMQPHPT